MNRETFKMLRSYRQYPCVTIVLPTHRTSPDNKQDAILLKNLVTEAQNRLSEEFTKRDLSSLAKNLQRVEEIDHNYNKEGLAIFINDQVFHYEKLLFKPEPRVVIDETFATRDIIRSMHKAENYYVMIISRQKVRLFEGYLEQVSEVINGNFPMLNETLYETQASNRSVSSKEDDLIKEFFNRADKAFNEIYKNDPADLILMGVDRNITHYQEICDKKSIIVGGITTGGDDAKPHEVAQLAWPLAKEVFASRQRNAIQNLKQAVSANKFESDLQQIYRAIQEGRGDTLFVELGYFQPATIAEDGQIVLSDDPKAPGVIDDLVDELAEEVLQYGGKVVFCENGSLEPYQRIALITRY